MLLGKLLDKTGDRAIPYRTSITSTDGDWGVRTKNGVDFAFHRNALLIFTLLENSEGVHYI